MRLRDMKYIGFKHQRENKQNSDKLYYRYLLFFLIQQIFFDNIPLYSWLYLTIPVEFFFPVYQKIHNYDNGFIT
jgi:hypothetical protein